MAKLLHTSYTFTPGGAGFGTVVLTGLNIQLEQLLLITNTTSNIIIYNFADPTKGGTRSFGSGNTTITLGFSTTGQNAADRLQIFYDDGATSTAVSGTIAISSIASGTNNIGDVDVLTVPAPLSTTGNGTAATALRVTVASDSTGVIAVTDNGGSLTVDGTVAATQSGTWSARLQDGSGNAITSATRGSERALSTQIVDASGNQITSFGGGTQYAEDVASVGGESMTLAGAIRQDAPSSTTSLDGDYSNLKTDSVGRLWVNNSGVTQPVSGTVTANLGTIAGVSTETTLSALNTKIPSNLTVTSTRLLVDGSGVTQPVSGTITANAGSGTFANNLTQLAGNAVNTGNGASGTGTLRVSLASDSTGVVASQFTRNAAAQTPTLDTVTAANNRPIPIVNLAGDGLAPLDVNSGAAGTTTLRTVLATRHEAAATPVAIRLSDGSAFITNLATNLAQYGGSTVGASNALHVQPGTGATFTLNTRHETATTPLAIRLTDGSAFISNLASNITQLAGNAVSTGNGTAGTGTLRVSIASDSTGQVALASQPARTATTDTITAKLATDAIQNGTTALTPKFASISTASSGNNTLVAAVTSKKIRVLSLILISAGSVNVTFQSGAGGTGLTGAMALTTNSGFTLPFNPVGWFETAVTTLLNLSLSGAIQVSGCLTYVEV